MNFDGSNRVDDFGSFEGQIDERTIVAAADRDEGSNSICLTYMVRVFEANCARRYQACLIGDIFTIGKYRRLILLRH